MTPLQLARSNVFKRAQEAYSAAVAVLDESDRHWLDKVLLRLDSTPYDQVRATPQDLAELGSLREKPIRKTDSRALHRLLREAWGDTLVFLVAGDRSTTGAMFAGPKPVMQTGYSPWGKPNRRSGPGTVSIVAACELAVQHAPEQSTSRRFLLEYVLTDCAEAVADAWLMYQVTGDDRFREVAVGIQNIALRGLGMTGAQAGDAPEAKGYFRALACQMDPEEGSCQAS